ncbi:MAG: trypsin-like peptidase domain-containing protein, partial [Chromatiales bacterium]|nr:trypsin-like peptidase domain-containing protein [Chromatiales bacterium]
MSAHLPFLLKAVVVGLALAFVAVLLKPDLLPSERPVVQVRQANPDNNVNARSIQPGSGPFSYADAVDKAAPAVVNIYTAKLITERRVPRYSDPVLEYFFGNRSPHGLRRRLESSLGSGVIISEQGYILTNNHVIDGASEIQVTLSDGRQMPAAVVGTDPDTDVAVLRVASRELSSIVVQNSDAPRVGDVVLAIGNPFGVGQTVTMGIVSATGRDKLGINTFEDFIQTDAAI